MKLFLLDYEPVNPEKVKELRSCDSFLLKVLGIQEKNDSKKGNNTSKRVLIEELVTPNNQFFYRVSQVPHFPAKDCPLAEIPSIQKYDPSIIYDESGFSSGAGI